MNKALSFLNRNAFLKLIHGMLFSSVCLPACADPNIAFFYGRPAPVDLLSHFTQVVVEAENMDNLDYLREKGTKVFAYISLGEVNATRSWYSEIPKNWFVGSNREWESDVIDLTQQGWHVFLIKVHNEVNRDYTQGYELILIGHAGHPEVIGTLGQVPDKFHLVSSVEDVERLEVERVDQLSYVTQTTLSVDECRDIVAALHKRFPTIKGPHQEDICYATQNRQNAVKKLTELVDVILVIGSPNSSNSNRLRELGEHCGIPSFLIDCSTDINPEWLRGIKAVGISAGASAPEVLVAEVVDYLKDHGGEVVEEVTVIEEDVEFLLPKELISAADITHS